MNSLEALAGFAYGFAASIPVASIVEGILHRYGLHALPSKRNLINRAMAEGHANHHYYFGTGRSRGNSYYNTPENAHAVSHFSRGNVAMIAGGSLIVGIAGNQAAENIFNANPEQSFWRVAGFTSGAMLYYAVYESTHHFMHFLEKEREKVGFLLSKKLKERYNIEDWAFSKPLLDDLRNYSISGLPQEEETKLAENLSIQIKEQYRSEFSEPNALSLLAEVRKDIQAVPRKKGFLTNIIDSVRNSKVFRNMDDHHFVHHYHHFKNLNVVLQLYDLLFRTKAPSNEKALANKKYWVKLPFPV